MQWSVVRGPWSWQDPSLVRCDLSHAASFQGQAGEYLCGLWVCNGLTAERVWTHLLFLANPS